MHERGWRRLASSASAWSSSIAVCARTSCNFELLSWQILIALKPARGMAVSSRLLEQAESKPSSWHQLQVTGFHEACTQEQSI